MNDPYARNADETREAMCAEAYHIGDAGQEIAVTFSHSGLPIDLGVMMDREMALEFLGRFTTELRHKGWLS